MESWRGNTGSHGDGGPVTQAGMFLLSLEEEMRVEKDLQTLLLCVQRSPWDAVERLHLFSLCMSFSFSLVIHFPHLSSVALPPHPSLHTGK